MQLSKLLSYKAAILYLKSHWARFRLETPAQKPSTNLSYLSQYLAGKLETEEVV
jgi:hypothetical protein